MLKYLFSFQHISFAVIFFFHFIVCCILISRLEVQNKILLDLKLETHFTSKTDALNWPAVKGDKSYAGLL